MRKQSVTARDLRLDLFGRRLREGDFVMRRRKGDPGESFQCHRGSFGVVEEFVEEVGEQRPNVKHVKPCETWTEVRVRPFSNRMVPRGETVIQWVPCECVKIYHAGFLVLAVLWPLVRLLHRAPLLGQSTDW